MANNSKNFFIMIALFAAGVLFLILAIAHKQDAPQGVVLQEVFNQNPSHQSTQIKAEIKVDPVPSPAIITSPVNGKEEGFTIQVYSFMDKARADKSLALLKEAGYKAFMEVSDLGEKGIFYRVRIGNIADEAQAKAILDQIRKDFKSGFIVKPKK